MPARALGSALMSSQPCSPFRRLRPRDYDSADGADPSQQPLGHGPDVEVGQKTANLKVKPKKKQTADVSSSNLTNPTHKSAAQPSTSAQGVQGAQHKRKTAVCLQPDRPPLFFPAQCNSSQDSTSSLTPPTHQQRRKGSTSGLASARRGSTSAALLCSSSNSLWQTLVKTKHPLPAGMQGELCFFGGSFFRIILKPGCSHFPLPS